MNNSTIGIKIADGTYYPILEEDSTKRKKLVLTTVNDDQNSVQIDLYQGEGKELQNARYAGSILIEDIMPTAKGEPEIELIVGVDEDGTLNAEAGDVGSDAKQSLSVSLESLEANVADIPDFELEDSVFDESDIEESGFEESSFEEAEFDDVPEVDEDMFADDEFQEDSSFDDTFEESFEDTIDDTFEESSPLGDESYPEDNYDDEEPQEPKKRPFALIILIILILLLLGLGAFLFLRSSGEEPVPPLVAEDTLQESPSPEPVTPEPVEPEVIVEAEPEEPEYTGGVPPEGRGGGVWYRLKWGDTLWNLSASFYRTPWLYGLIAVENDIKNPDVIYAGADIFIPEN